MIFALSGVAAERSEGDGIDSVEAKRSPLSPNFNLDQFSIEKIRRQQRSKEQSDTEAVTQESTELGQHEYSSYIIS